MMKLLRNSCLSGRRPRWAAYMIVLGLWGCGSSGGPNTAERGYTLDKGVIRGAKFTLAVPRQWSGEMLVIAHGYRPPKAPLLAELDLADPVVVGLLKQGWLVATTSYRRNGMVIADAQEDIHNLIGAVIGKYGPCRQVLIEGSSMGANIALLMAEQPALPYSLSGVLALGAALDAEGESGAVAWAHAPRLPVLFVSNRSEITPVLDYGRRVRRDRNHPAVWVLDRDGHVNINGLERLAAIKALSEWSSGGPAPAGNYAAPHDATVDLSDRVSTATVTEHVAKKSEPDSVPVSGRRGRVVAVDPFYGNVRTDLVAEDLRGMGLKQGDPLHLVCGKVKRKAYWGTTYSDVAEGELVVFLYADGMLQVAVNMGNAARRLKCHPDEPLEIMPWFDHSPRGRYH